MQHRHFDTRSEGGEIKTRPSGASAMGAWSAAACWAYAVATVLLHGCGASGNPAISVAPDSASNTDALSDAAPDQVAEAARTLQPDAAVSQSILLQGDYIPDPSRAGAGVAQPTTLTLSQPADNASTSPPVFSAAEDLVIEQIAYAQRNMPTSATDVTLTNDGDICLYARTPAVDPGPSELFCFSSYTTVPYPAGGLDWTIAYPPDAGLFFPKGSTFTCPSHLHRSTGGTFSTEQLAAATWSCKVTYHLASASETVLRDARIPYIDTGLNPTADAGHIIDESIGWYRGWSDATHPLTVRGYMVYAGATGLTPQRAGQTHTYDTLCLHKASPDGGTEQSCNPDFAYSAQANVPSTSFFPGFIALNKPMVLQPGDQLYASCRSPDDMFSDCTLYVFYETSSAQRVSTIADYYWDLGEVNLDNIGPGGPFCGPEGMAHLTPAGKGILATLAATTFPPWNADGCSLDASDMGETCACQGLFKRAP
jgi:hypothetical protein